MRISLILAAGVGACIAGCGGGGGGNNNSPPPPPPPKPTVTLSVDPASIKLGENATLTWSSTNATICTAGGAWGGSKAINTTSTQTVTPASPGNNHFTLTCAGVNAADKASAFADLSAAAVTPKAMISVSPGSIVKGDSATLTWSSTDATSCTATAAPASPEWSGAQVLSGTRTVMPNVSTSYTLTCNGPGGSHSLNAPLTVFAQPPAVTISVNPATINLGQQPPATLSWSTTQGLTSCKASGTDSAWTSPQDKAANGTQNVMPPAGTSTYTLTCTNASGANPVAGSASLKVNSTITNFVAIAVDGGPDPIAHHTVNLPYISVMVCGGLPKTCKTIDHVDVDTASYGLRIFASALGSSTALETQQFNGNDPVAECVQFIQGYAWGSVRLADVQLAGEVAQNLPVQVIGDLPETSVPSKCSMVPPGSNLPSFPALTAQSIGSNGILGVGPFIHDCLHCADQPLEPHYYDCPFNGTCTPITQTLANQVQNPVAAFASDNNGVVVELPIVAAGGAQKIVGKLTFGIGTQDNNALSGGLIALDTFGDFTTDDPSKDPMTTSAHFSKSFIDSGSNRFIIPATLGSQPIPPCANPGPAATYYCPSQAINIPLINRATSAAFGTGIGANIPIANAAMLFMPPSNDAFNNLAGGPALPNGLDFGLPFFFGKRISVGIEGKPTPGVTSGPWVAY